MVPISEPEENNKHIMVLQTSWFSQIVKVHVLLDVCV